LSAPNVAQIVDAGGGDESSLWHITVADGDGDGGLKEYRVEAILYASAQDQIIKPSPYWCHRESNAAASWCSPWPRAEKSYCKAAELSEREDSVLEIMMLR
jgi:hypothetical protein